MAATTLRHVRGDAQEQNRRTSGKRDPQSAQAERGRQSGCFLGSVNGRFDGGELPRDRSRQRQEQPVNAGPNPGLLRHVQRRFDQYRIGEQCGEAGRVRQCEQAPGDAGLGVAYVPGL